MSYKVVGLYDYRSDAKAVKEQLENAGFTNVDYSKNEKREDYTTDDQFNYAYREDDNSGAFWDWMTEDEKDEATRLRNRDRYSRVASRCDVITVHVDTSEEATRAQQIMDEAGAVDPYEYDTTYTEFNRKYNEPTYNRTKAIDDYDQYRDDWRTRDVGTERERNRSRIIDRDLQDDRRLRNDRNYERRAYTDELRGDNDYRTSFFD